MPEESGPGIKLNEGKKHKLGYMQEFRDMLRMHPDIIKTAMELVNRTVSEYDPHEIKYGRATLRYDKGKNIWTQRLDDSGEKPMGMLGRGTLLVPGKPAIDKSTGLEVTLLGRSNRVGLGLGLVNFNLIEVADYFKITLKEKSYFAKRTFISQSPGFTEFEDTLKAKELLKGLDFVKVISAQLGYQDEKEGWFISSWEDLETSGFRPVDWSGGIDSYGNRLKDPSKEEYDYVEQKKRQIEERLRPARLHGDTLQNLFYNPETKQFIYLDISGYHLEDGKTLGTPVRRGN